jgi:hypothetical protein
MIALLVLMDLVTHLCQMIIVSLARRTVYAKIQTNVINVLKVMRSGTLSALIVCQGL